MNRHAAILDDLGGKAYLANVLGLKDETVKKWYQRGIPPRHWHRIIALEPALTPELLDRTKPWGIQSRKKRRR
jgi:hypothetical protein